MRCEGKAVRTEKSVRQRGPDQVESPRQSEGRIDRHEAQVGDIRIAILEHVDVEMAQQGKGIPEQSRNDVPARGNGLCKA